MKKTKSGESEEIHKLLGQLFGYEIHKSLLFILSIPAVFLMAEGLTYVKCMQRIKSTPKPSSPILLNCPWWNEVQRSLKALLDSMGGGGAWPFLVGGVICVVNSVNERDLSLLTSIVNMMGGYFLEGLFVFNEWKFEAITGL